MKTVITHIPRQDYCEYCNSNRSIELYDKNNKALNYSHILDYVEQGKEVDLSNRNLKYMKCKKCGHVFKLLWCNQKVPDVLHNESMIDIFVESLKR